MATRYEANPGFVLLVSFYLILRMNSLAQATAVSYLTLRVGWQRGDPPLCVPMSNTTDAESDTDIILQFELVLARCFFAPSPHHPRRQSLVMKTDRPQLASGQSHKYV